MLCTVLRGMNCIVMIEPNGHRQIVAQIRGLVSSRAPLSPLKAWEKNQGAN